MEHLENRDLFIYLFSWRIKQLLTSKSAAFFQIKHNNILQYPVFANLKLVTWEYCTGILVWFYSLTIITARSVFPYVNFRFLSKQYCYHNCCIIAVIIIITIIVFLKTQCPNFLHLHKCHNFTNVFCGC